MDLKMVKGLKAKKIHPIIVGYSLKQYDKLLSYTHSVKLL